MHLEAVTPRFSLAGGCSVARTVGIFASRLPLRRKCKPKLRTGAQRKTTVTSSGEALRNSHNDCEGSTAGQTYFAWEGFMYIFFLPSLLALVVIGSIQLRDQFRFTVR